MIMPAILKLDIYLILENGNFFAYFLSLSPLFLLGVGMLLDVGRIKGVS